MFWVWACCSLYTRGSEPHLVLPSLRCLMMCFCRISPHKASSLLHYCPEMRMRSGSHISGLHYYYCGLSLDFFAITLQRQRSWQHKFWINLYEVKSGAAHARTHSPVHTHKLPPGTEGINNSHTFLAYLMCSLLWHLQKPKIRSLWEGDLWNHYSPAITLQPP